MASLLLAASILGYNKVQDRRAAKKDKKRLGYERRYSELEQEHEKFQKTALDQQEKEGGNEKEAGKEKEGGVQGQQGRQQQQNVFYDDKDGSGRSRARRRSSSESDRARSVHSRSRSRSGDRDDPAAWVNGVLRERERREK